VAELTGAQSRLIDQATAASAGPASLSDIEHVVILMQENRSFDHYFGTLSGVRGFSDPQTLSQVFDQYGYQPGKGPDASGYMQPFRLYSDPPARDGQTTNDISHTWPTQHDSWNAGAMDKFVATHVSVDGAAHGPVTMGYYTRADLPFYYALADAFTVCDAYYSSVLGPTDPNRLMSMSATIDPAGTAGGPVLETFGNRIAEYGKLSWETMPERLQAAGVSWKVYNDRLSELALSPLPYFKAYNNPFSVTGAELVGRGLTPDLDDFGQDIQQNKLPSVSWIMPPLAECEHPAAPPGYGEYFINSIMSALVSNPAVWAQTVLFVTYDENGGFFDHVPPLTPARRGGRDHRARRPRLPRSRPGHLAVQPGRLRVLAVVRPHLAAALHRDQVRRRGAQPVAVAARRDRRPDRGARAVQAAGYQRPGAAPHLPRPDRPRRAGGTQLAGRHAGPGHRLPAACRQLDAVPGDQPAATARAVTPLSHAGDGSG